MHYFLEVYYLHSVDLAPVLLYAALWEADPDALWPIQPEPAVESLSIQFSFASAPQDCPAGTDSSLVRMLSLIPAGEAEEFLRSLRAGYLDLSIIRVEGLPSIKLNVIPRPPVLQLDRHSEDARNAWFMAPESRSVAASAWVETFWPITEPPRAQTFSVPVIDLFAHMRKSEPGRKSIQQILSYLETQTGLSFSRSYSQRIGCVEHHSFLHRLAASDFSLRREPRVPGPSGRLSSGIIIIRSETLRQERHIAHVVMRNVRDIILSEIVFLPAGASESRLIASQERFSEYEVSVYKRDGRTLVYHKHTEECRGFGMSMMLVHSQHRVSDSNFSKKLSHKPALQQRVEMVPEGLRSTISTEDFKDDPWYKISAMVKDVVGATSVRRSRSSRFFPKGDEGQVEIMEYLQSLIAADNVAEVILADPFFNAPALARLLLRIPHAKSSILVITSLNGAFVDELKLILQKSRTILPRQLTVVNISRGDEQAFHDRYLYVVKAMADARLYVLSNSINKAGGRWPFCVAEVDDVTTQSIAQYLRGLAEGEDIYDANVADIHPVILWPDDQAKVPPPRPKRRTLQSRAWFRQFLAWLLDNSTDDYETQILTAQERGMLRCEPGRIDSISFIRDQMLAAVEARMDDGCHLLGRVSSIILSLGEVNAHSARSGEEDSGSDLAVYTKRLIDKHLALPGTDISKLLEALCSISESQSADAEGASPAAEEALKLLQNEAITLETLRDTEIILNEHPWRGDYWGLSHCLGVLTVHFTTGVSDWLKTAHLGPSVSLVLISSWKDLCSYRKAPEMARRLILSAQGCMRRFFLALAIGSRRCPPSMSLKELALVLEEVGISTGERAVILLSSFEDRRFNQEPDGWEDLLDAWPKHNFTRADEDLFWKYFKDFRIHELAILAASLSERGSGVRAKWLDRQIVRSVKRRYLCSEHDSPILSHHDLDFLDIALAAWWRSDKRKLSEILPNKKEIAAAINWLGRPFAREVFFSKWTKYLIFLSACGYIGAQVCEMKPQHPDMAQFVPVFVPEIVVPLLSQLTLAHFSQIDPRVPQALVRVLAKYLRSETTPEESFLLATRICASARFSPEVRKECDRYLRQSLERSVVSPTGCMDKDMTDSEEIG